MLHAQKIVCHNILVEYIMCTNTQSSKVTGTYNLDLKFGINHTIPHKFNVTIDNTSIKINSQLKKSTKYFKDLGPINHKGHIHKFFLDWTYFKCVKHAYSTSCLFVHTPITNTVTIYMII